MHVTAHRFRFSLQSHGALELLVGLALIALPFALGLGAPALVIAAVAGVLVAGLGLSGPESLPLRTHLALDQALAAALAGAALAMAAAGEAAGALLLAAAAAVELVLLLGTRWSRR
jgi:hypothetical protein